MRERTSAMICILIAIKCLLTSCSDNTADIVGTYEFNEKLAADNSHWKVVLTVNKDKTISLNHYSDGKPLEAGSGKFSFDGQVLTCQKLTFRRHGRDFVWENPVLEKQLGKKVVLQKK